MMISKAPPKSLLGVGLYTAPEVARILGIPCRTVNRWTRGYHYKMAGDKSVTRFSEPMLHLQIVEDLDEPVLTFENLIEILFISLFQKEGVKLPVIRAAANVATRVFHTDHPFAVKRFITDGKSVFAALKDVEVEDIAKDELVSNLNLGQMVMEACAAPYFKKIDYDHDILMRYWPMGNDKRVVIDPRRSFGKSIDSISGVPTSVLYKMRRSGESAERIADWYKVDVQAVYDAVEYESSLLKAA